MAASRSALGWLHLVLTILLGGALLTLAGLAVLGRAEIRFVQPNPGSASPLPSLPRIDPIDAACFDLLGHQAFCFQYQGADIDCWIEVEMEGKTTKVAEGLGEQLRAAAKLSDAGPSSKSGRLIWVVRRQLDQSYWDVAISLTEGGATKAQASNLGIVPPRPKSARGGGSSGAQGAVLRPAREYTLAEVMTFGEAAGTITSKARLKCRIAPAD